MDFSDIGLIGLAVMGENLALNMASKGFRVSVYNRTSARTEEFVNGRAAGKSIRAAYSLDDLVAQLCSPRRIMLMVKAGEPVDALLASLSPLLDAGDVLIDGGNSYFEDTQRRMQEAKVKGLFYVGCGVSGGEEGALQGPSMMPGGSPEAWPLIRPIFQAICAKAPDAEPCCTWVGEGGAGHFVKMVHNGIEYGDMELICEAYHLLRSLTGMEHRAMADVFDRWNRSELDSYLIEITRDILRYKDAAGEVALERILDAAGQKGTGQWTVMTALKQHSALSLITEAVFARVLSAQWAERQLAAKYFPKSVPDYEGDLQNFVDQLGSALYAAKIISYAQGFDLMRRASEAYDWKLKYGDVALMWRGGCIIRSAFLGRIKEAFTAEPNVGNLILAPYFRETITERLPAWRNIVATAVQAGIPVPALSAALAYFDAYTSRRLPANLLQAQRDYFGAHGYERLDKPRGVFFHTDWTGRGGATAAQNYSL